MLGSNKQRKGIKKHKHGSPSLPNRLKAIKKENGFWFEIANLKQLYNIVKTFCKTLDKFVK